MLNEYSIDLKMNPSSNYELAISAVSRSMALLLISNTFACVRFDLFIYEYARFF